MHLMFVVCDSVKVNLVGHATEELKHDLETPPPVIMALVVLQPKSFNS